MKNNIKALELIEKGLSAKTVSKLTESQVNILHKKLFNEQPQPQIVNKTVKQIKLPSGAQTTVGGVSITNQGGTTTITTTNETELDEEDEVEMDPNKDQETQDPHQVGPSTNDGFGPEKPSQDKEYQDGQSLDETKKQKKNPWAICTAQMGDEFGTTERSEWTKPQMKKYERCVMDVKKSLKEGKNPVSLFIENEIVKIVEKHIPPRITKGELMKYLNEAEPTTAPPKPKKPVTKPDTKPRPTRPGQNPFPGEKEAPKAKSPKVSPEEAKNKVIKSIMNILKK